MGSMIDKFLFLAIFCTIAYTLWKFMGLGESAKPEAPEPSTRVQAPPPAVEQQKQTVDPAFEDRPEVTASPLVVRHLTDKATLLIRHRTRKNVVTAHLMIWSGAKRKRINDSFYDLGAIPGVEAGEDVIEEFVGLAKTRLDELAAAGRRTRKSAKVVGEVEVQPDVATECIGDTASHAPPVCDAATQAVEPDVVVDETPPGTTKLLKFPSLYRGVITEIGMMPQSKDGREFETFGVRFRTPGGIEDAVYGANLRVALRKANAGVGDSVEIVRLGRRTVDPNKAPMNLFSVAKLQLQEAST